MYVYLYDNFLKQKKFDRHMKAIETRLTDYGIAGKIIRLQRFTDAAAMIEDEKNRGDVSGVIVVGNDVTFGHVLSRAATCDILFGFIPVGNENTIADVLGIPSGVSACDVLARRRKVLLDVGWFNNRYFIGQLYILPSDIVVTYDERFCVSTKDHMKIEFVVCNLQPFVWKKYGRDDVTVHPQDGKLEAFLRPVRMRFLGRKEYEEPSIFPFEEMIVSSKTPFVVSADGMESKETRITIRLAKKRLQMIVGKERKF